MAHNQRNLTRFSAENCHTSFFDRLAIKMLICSPSLLLNFVFVLFSCNIHYISSCHPTISYISFLFFPFYTCILIICKGNGQIHLSVVNHCMFLLILKCIFSVNNSVVNKFIILLIKRILDFFISQQTHQEY